MTILGIELRFPSTADLLGSLLAAGLVVALLVLLTALRILEPKYAAMLAASSLGGALANAYGASIKNQDGGA